MVRSFLLCGVTRSVCERTLVIAEVSFITKERTTINASVFVLYMSRNCNRSRTDAERALEEGAYEGKNTYRCTFVRSL